MSQPSKEQNKMMTSLGHLVKYQGHKKFLARKGPTEVKYWVLGFGPARNKVVVYAADGNSNTPLAQVNADETDWEVIE